MNFDLTAFTPQQIDALIKQAEQRKRQLAKRRPINEVRARLSAEAQRLGYTIEDVFEASGGSAQDSGLRGKGTKRRSSLKGTKAPVKYRDPEHKHNTWSGRGSMPRWLAEKVKRGQSAADFLIPGLAKPTANAKNVGKRTVVKKGEGV